MLRIALTHARTRAVAEEVVQEAWLGVLQGLDRFEGRSSLKTWILRIVANRARTRGERERRSVPLSSLRARRGRAGRRPRPLPPPDDPRYPGGWASRPQLGAAGGAPARRRDAGAGAGRDRHAPAAPAGGDRPARRRGLGAGGGRHGARPDDGNQRVLLHRARSKVRDELERYFGGDRHEAGGISCRRSSSSSRPTWTARCPPRTARASRRTSRLCGPCVVYVEQVRAHRARSSRSPRRTRAPSGSRRPAGCVPCPSSASTTVPDAT